MEITDKLWENQNFAPISSRSDILPIVVFQTFLLEKNKYFLVFIFKD